MGPVPRLRSRQSPCHCRLARSEAAVLLLHTVGRCSHRLEAILLLEQVQGPSAVSSLAAGVHLALHGLAELDLQAAWQLQTIFALQRVGDAAPLPDWLLTRMTAS